MKIHIIYGSKADIQILPLNDLIKKFDVAIMLMTDVLDSRFIDDVYDIGWMGQESTGVLILATDPSLTMVALDELSRRFPAISLIVDAQQVNRPQRPANMPIKQTIGYIGKEDLIDLRQRHFYRSEWLRKFEQQTDELLKMTPEELEDMGIMLGRMAAKSPLGFGLSKDHFKLKNSTITEAFKSQGGPFARTDNQPPFEKIIPGDFRYSERIPLTMNQIRLERLSREYYGDLMARQQGAFAIVKIGPKTPTAMQTADEIVRALGELAELLKPDDSDLPE
jgi:hypothetical protein